MGLSERLLERQTVGKELQPFPPFSCPLLEVQSSQTIKYLKDSGLGIGWQNKGNKRTLSSVQLLSRVQLFATPRTAAHQASLSITNSWSLLKFISIELLMPSNHLILCCPLLLPPSVFPSIRVFSNEAVFHIRSPKYWSFSFSISPSNEYSGHWVPSNHESHLVCLALNFFQKKEKQICFVSITVIFDLSSQQLNSAEVRLYIGFEVTVMKKIKEREKNTYSLPL